MDIKLLDNNELEWVSSLIPGEINRYYWSWEDFAFYFSLGGVLQATDFFESNIAVNPDGLMVWDLT